MIARRLSWKRHTAIMWFLLPSFVLWAPVSASAAAVISILACHDGSWGMLCTDMCDPSDPSGDYCVHGWTKATLLRHSDLFRKLLSLIDVLFSYTVYFHFIWWNKSWGTRRTSDILLCFALWPYLEYIRVYVRICKCVYIYIYICICCHFSELSGMEERDYLFRSCLCAYRSWYWSVWCFLDTRAAG